jgi:glycine/D-amino acid oxidase-like deaminating enzyme
VPRDHGEIVVGATVEERGFDTTVTAGAVLSLLQDAWELLPGLAEAELVEAVAGLRPATPDNLPLIGSLGPSGPLAATGHHRHGILLTPLTADLVAHLVLGVAVPDPRHGDGLDTAPFLAACDPGRFGSGAGLRGPNAEAGLRGPNAEAGLRGPNAEAGEHRGEVPA